jgi:hypothetical protein
MTVDDTIDNLISTTAILLGLALAFIVLCPTRVIPFINIQIMEQPQHQNTSAIPMQPPQSVFPDISVQFNTPSQTAYAKSVDYEKIEPMLDGLRENYAIYHSNHRDWNTYSMNGTFGIGNTLIIETHPENLSIGDIIGFHKEGFGEGNGATHRIIRMENGCIYTKGDANIAEDGVCITNDEVSYRVIGVIYTKDEVKP